MAEVRVARVEEIPPGEMTFIDHDGTRIGVFNCAGALLAIEDRCTHDDGPLCLGLWDTEECTIVCPRHGARFDLRTGRALTLPAYLPARTFPVRLVDGMVTVEVG